MSICTKETELDMAKFLHQQNNISQPLVVPFYVFPALEKVSTLSQMKQSS